jgi:lipopolysaccharide biosynthesis regulator YciM
VDKGPQAEPSRRELEIMWRERVDQARSRYEYKSVVCKLLLAERVEAFPILSPDPDGTLALHQALQREFETRGEFRRVLRIYTDLVTRGSVPADNPDS